MWQTQAGSGPVDGRGPETAVDTTTSREDSLGPVFVGVAVTAIGTLPLFLTGALAVQMRADLGFGVVGLGVAAATVRLSGVAAAGPFGRLADRIGPTGAMRLAALMSLVTGLLVGLWADDLLTLCIALAASGAANPLGQSGANILIARSVAANRRGLAFGLKQSALPLSTLLAGLAVPIFALTLGWRSAFIATAALSGALTLLVPSVPHQRRGPESGRQRTETPTRLLLLLASGMMLAMMAGASLTTFAVDGAVTTGLSPSAAGGLLVAGSIVSIITRIAAGLRADRNAGDHFLGVVAMMVVGSLGYGMLALGTPLLVVIGTMVGFAFGWGFNGLFWHAIIQMEPNAPGRVTGLVLPGGMLGAVFGPPLFGWIVDASGYGAAWSAAAVWALLGATVLLLTSRNLAARRGRPTNG